MAAHSSIFAGRIPWTEEPGQATDHEVAEADTGRLSYLLSLRLGCTPQCCLCLHASHVQLEFVGDAEV